MYCRYGNFNFEPWEASIAVNAEFKRNKTGFKTFQHLTFTFSGNVVGTDQYAVNTRLNQISAAFSIDGQSCGLVHDNGTPTLHWMPNTADEPTNLTNVQVLDMKLPESTNGEFATGRHFRIEVGSMYEAYDSAVIDWHDSLTRSGNAGPEWEWERWKSNGWVPRKKSPNTMQRIIHAGHAIGSTTWPAIPAPFYSQPFELNHLREVTHHSPMRYMSGYVEYPVSWRYTYVLPTFDDTTAPTLP